MIRRGFDSDGDYAINKFIDQSAATIQAVTTRLRLFAGEWFLNIEDGVPWFSEIFVKPARVNEANSIIRDTIQQTEGVDSILSYDSNFDSNTRKLAIRFTAKTIYGDIFSDEDIVGINV